MNDFAGDRRLRRNRRAACPVGPNWEGYACGGSNVPLRRRCTLGLGGPESSPSVEVGGSAGR